MSNSSIPDPSASWPQLTLGECFTIQSAARAIEAPASADLFIYIDPENRTATIHPLKEGDPVPPRSLLLTAKGPMEPEFLRMLVASPHGNQGLFESLRKLALGGYVRNVAPSELARVSFAVPDKDTQLQMIKSNERSALWLLGYTDSIRRQADLLEKLSWSLTHEIVRGKLDEKEALLHVRDALNPQMAALAALNREHERAAGANSQTSHTGDAPLESSAPAPRSPKP